MRIRMYCARPFLAAGVAAVAITTAPIALAGPNEQVCADVGGSTQCQRTGNMPTCGPIADTLSGNPFR
jgi:hypothetical protein